VGANPFESENPAAYPVGRGAEYLDGVERQPGLGSPIRVQVWFRRGFLGPIWTALCGALASGGVTLSAAPLLRLALVALLVDVVWGGLWSALMATDWATSLGRWQNWRRGTPVRLLPHTSPDGPAGRLARHLGHLRSWWTGSAGPTLGPTLAGLALLLPLALVMAGVLGVRPLLVTLLAITLLQFVFAWTGGDARPVPGPQALFEIALPWLAGHVLFALPTLPSIALALAYTLSYAGGLRLAQGWTGLARWNLGQITAIVVLVAARQPTAAGITGLLFMGQAMLQPGLIDEETDQVAPPAAARFLRWAQPWLMAALLVAAWGCG